MKNKKVTINPQNTEDNSCFQYAITTALNYQNINHHPDYINNIKPQLKDIIDYCKSKGEWKIQITMRIIFISFIDKNQTQLMHTKSDNVEIMNGTDTNEAINELINSFMKRYQEGLETEMKGSSYIFERVDLLEYHLHKINLNRGSSYVDSPK